FIFAIIVGAVILFLAVFAAVKYANSSSQVYNTQVAEQLNILLDPLETSLASSIATSINFKEETKLSLDCKDIGFGSSDVRIDVKSSVGQWQGFGVPASSANKYIYSSKQEQGKQLSIFSRSFEMPFFVSDLIYASMKQYCFVDTPEEMAQEIEEINVSNIKLVSRVSECKKNMTTVCFGSSGCNINVYGTCSDCYNSYDYGYVSKGSIKINYVSSSLMYAAIFSDSSIYNCNFERLMYRLNKLADLYTNKAVVLEAKGCSTGDIKTKLEDLKRVTSTTPSSPGSLYDISNQLENVNYELSCRLW
ncbi:hypothetical protein HZA33_01070, partial [Candidatus Pacearchaeota archaeon]|nr:hypothetical protein [Candidatus Pacearchaeota archaeon]